jgi:hypothetical protein
MKHILTPAHHAAVDHQRRIFFHHDLAADIQHTGGFGSDIIPLGPNVPRGLHFSNNILHPGTSGAGNIELPK